MNNGILDSGSRKEWETGARRDVQTGKGRFDLIPFRGLLRVARQFEGGGEKYGFNNWQKGIPLRTYANSALRHLLKYLAGWKDEDHLAAVAWNILCLIYTEEEIAEGLLPAYLDDLADPDRSARQAVEPEQPETTEPSAGGGNDNTPLGDGYLMPRRYWI